MKRIKLSSKLVRPAIVAACAAVVGLSVYGDWLYTQNSADKGVGYVYNSAVSGEKAKILGEATFVGNLANGSENDPTSATDDYFYTSALSRQQARDESLEILQEVVDSSETMPEQKNKALSDITKIANAMESEANIETLIKGKGFEECLAVIGDDSVNVIVKTTGLLTYEVAQIKEIVMQELGISADKIKIVEKIS